VIGVILECTPLHQGVVLLRDLVPGAPGPGLPLAGRRIAGPRPM
jgi:hypothetical protein